MDRIVPHSPAARMGGLVIVLTLLALAAVVLVRDDGSPGASRSEPVPPPRYLALGDSVAVGVGATNPLQGGYVALFRQGVARLLGDGSEDDAHDHPAQVEATNLAVGGETSASLITEGQLSSALELLGRSEEPARHVITLTIGGNDAVPLLRICGRDPAADPSEACLAATDAVLARFGENLAAILRELRTVATPDDLIIVSTYYNSLQHPRCLFHAFEGLAGDVIGRLNGVIESTAAAVPGVRVADVAGAGLGADDLQADCLHPDDSGYARIAEAFLAALEPAAVG